MNPEVDDYILHAKQWQAELQRLRTIALDCGLTELLKWRQPCYCYEEKNVVILNGFKNYVALNFFKGALLADPHGLLVAPSEHVQAGRQIRLTSLHEIDEKAPLLREYILAAIEVEKRGLKVDFRQSRELVLVDELLACFKSRPELKEAFAALTPGRQRAYNLYFGGAKQAATRTARVERCIERILAGKGLND